MKILMNVTPSLNKFVKDEKEWLNLLKNILQREMGMGDLDGKIHNINVLPEIKQKT